MSLWHSAESISFQHFGVLGIQKTFGYPADTVRFDPACLYWSTMVVLERSEILDPGTTIRQWMTVGSVPGNHPDLSISAGT